MRLKKLMIMCLLLLTAGLSTAQPEAAARLDAVGVEGTTWSAALVRVVLASRSGTLMSDIDLEAERTRVYALGSFAAVSVNLDSRAGGNTLVVTVRENPRIDSITFEGVSAVAEDQLRQIVESENILSPGRVLNTTRAQEEIGRAACRGRG